MKARNRPQNKHAAWEVDKRLGATFGAPRRSKRDAVAQLVATILSQATTDVQTARSFDELRRRFPTWQRVRDARVRDIARAIRASGLAQQKAPRIKAALQDITRERGRITLAFLKTMPVADARRWLMNIKGVGPKTAAIVLLFSFDLPVFPVDTHIYRVAKRLGWIAPRASVEKAHALLGAAIPPKIYYRLHINLIRHGRAVCRARTPRCNACALTDLCAYYAQQDLQPPSV